MDRQVAVGNIENLHQYTTALLVSQVSPEMTFLAHPWQLGGI